MQRLLTALLFVLLGLVGAPTTTASAAAYTYDVPTITRVGVPAIGAAEASPPQRSVVREGFAAPTSEASGSSTPPNRSVVAPEAAGAGPRVGGSASLDNLTPRETTRIQNAANKVDQPISVVGSRASGAAGPYSDWDYVVPGANSSTVGKIKNSLPEGPRGIGDPRNIDIFRGQVNEDLPFITFTPTPR